MSTKMIHQSISLWYVGNFDCSIAQMHYWSSVEYLDIHKMIYNNDWHNQCYGVVWACSLQYLALSASAWGSCNVIGQLCINIRCICLHVSHTTGIVVFPRGIQTQSYTKLCDSYYELVLSLVMILEPYMISYSSPI